MFDDWDKITNIYTNASASGRLFLDSDIISIYIKMRCQNSGIPNSIARQLVLYCRLLVANLTSKTELETFIASNNLDRDLINNIVEMCMHFYISEADYVKTTPDISFETRLQVLSSAGSAVQFLWNNKDLKLSLIESTKRYNLPSIKRYLITVSDIILGFYKIEDTVPLLQQELDLDPKTAALLGAEVLEFLAPLSDPNWAPPIEINADEETESELPGSIPADSEPEVSRIPLKSPALFSTPAAVTPTQAEPAYIVEPTPVYQPAPAGYMSTPTPAPTPVYQSSQPTPAPAPLSTIPSYTPAPTPPTPVAPAPTPDRPKWSTEI